MPTKIEDATLDQETVRNIDIVLTSAGNTIHLSQEDEDSTGEFDLGIIVERRAIPRLIRLLRQFGTGQ